MSKKHHIRIIVLIIVLIFLALISPVKAEAPMPEVKPIPTDVKGMIVYYADKYDANEHELLTVAKCESSLNQEAIGDHGQANGIFQFHEPTFIRYSKLMGETLNYNSAHDQAKLASFIFANYPQEKRAWTCWSSNFNR